MMGSGLIKHLVKQTGFVRGLSSIASTTLGKTKLTVLGIETSCDDTAASVVTSDGEILSNIVFSHRESVYRNKGIHPHESLYLHIENIDRVVALALQTAKTDISQVSAVAATFGPGMRASLQVGMEKAFDLCKEHSLPFAPVNHLEGHILTPRLVHMTQKKPISFPFLALVISGGNSQLIVAESLDSYKILGKTLDIAPGVAFDKLARELDLISLSTSGGENIQRLVLKYKEDLDVLKGDPNHYNHTKFKNCPTVPLKSLTDLFKEPMLMHRSCDFSFSAFQLMIQRLRTDLGPSLSEFQKACLLSSFQERISDHICRRLARALKYSQLEYPSIKQLTLSGGVASNLLIKQRIETICVRNGIELIATPPSLCVDNAAMIAWAGIEHLLVSGPKPVPESLFVDPKLQLGPDISKQVIEKNIRIIKKEI